MNESERQYWIGFGDGKKSVLDDLLLWHPDLAKNIAAVKAHAAENYERGWDSIVECYEDLDIALRIVGAKTSEEAIASLAIVAEVRMDRISDARVEGGEYWGSVDC